MRKNSLFVAILGASILMSNSQNAFSQAVADEKKFEAGAQFVLLNQTVGQATFTGIACVTVPCPSFVPSNERDWHPGFGGRFGYNVTNSVAFEAELNFFPGAGSFKVPDAFKGGHEIEGLFGVKAGKHFDKVGIFGKVRPGFLHASKGDIRPRSNVACIAITILPPPIGCFETTSTNSFAFDLGGVVEVYPTKRMLIRFDAGDTLVRLRERTVPGVFNPGPLVLAPSFLTIVRVPADTTHNFQASLGVGFRF